MSDDPDFRAATRRVLFPRSSLIEAIPGAHRSAADEPDRHLRVKVTMNVDADVVRFFKVRAKEEGRSYQSLINQVLREHIEGSNPEKLSKKVGALLLDDPRFLEALKKTLGEEEHE